MSETAKALAEFHEALGQPYGSAQDPDWVTEFDERKVALRRTLHQEEAWELEEALIDGTPVEMAQELADVVYVAYGTAHLLGIPLDAVLAEIHRANMAKFINGKPVLREDGKVLKPEGWKPADIRRVLAEAAEPSGEALSEKYDYFGADWDSQVFWRYRPGQERGETIYGPEDHWVGSFVPRSEHEAQDARETVPEWAR